MKTTQIPIARTTKRPRISKGILVASTNTARVICLKQYLTLYLFNPINYSIVKKVIVNLPIIP